MYLGLNKIDICVSCDSTNVADKEISKVQWKYFRKEYFAKFSA
jgi:ferredoxin-like protein FixX